MEDIPLAHRLRGWFPAAVVLLSGFPSGLYVRLVGSLSQLQYPYGVLYPEGCLVPLSLWDHLPGLLGIAAAAAVVVGCLDLPWVIRPRSIWRTGRAPLARPLLTGLSVLVLSSAMVMGGTELNPERCSSKTTAAMDLASRPDTVSGPTKLANTALLAMAAIGWLGAFGVWWTRQRVGRLAIEERGLRIEDDLIAWVDVLAVEIDGWTLVVRAVGRPELGLGFLGGERQRLTAFAAAADARRREGTLDENALDGLRALTARQEA